jgi:hypothetical protein
MENIAAARRRSIAHLQDALDNSLVTGFETFSSTISQLFHDNATVHIWGLGTYADPDSIVEYLSLATPLSRTWDGAFDLDSLITDRWNLHDDIIYFRSLGQVNFRSDNATIISEQIQEFHYTPCSDEIVEFNVLLSQEFASRVTPDDGKPDTSDWVCQMVMDFCAGPLQMFDSFNDCRAYYASLPL